MMMSCIHLKHLISIFNANLERDVDRVTGLDWLGNACSSTRRSDGSVKEACATPEEFQAARAIVDKVGMLRLVHESTSACSKPLGQDLLSGTFHVP